MAQYIYESIKEYLLRIIRENKDKPQYLLPSENQLAVKFNTTRITAKRALNELQSEGYIYRKHGKGSFINTKASETSIAPVNEFVCMLLPNIDSIFISRMVAGAKEVCANYGYTLLLMIESEERIGKFNLISELVRRQIKGIIVFPNNRKNYNKDLLVLALKDFPVVFVDRSMDNLDVSSVLSNHEEAGRFAVKKLVELGCKNIGFISVPFSTSTSAQERIMGYEHAHVEQKMLIRRDYVLQVSKHQEDLDEQIEEYFLAHPEIDGLFSYGDILGIHVYKVLKKLKIKVPEQLKIIFLDDEYANYADILPVSPSCLIQQSREIGKQAATLLIKYLHGLSKHDEKILLDYTFIERDSTKEKNLEEI